MWWQCGQPLVTGLQGCFRTRWQLCQLRNNHSALLVRSLDLIEGLALRPELITVSWPLLPED
jgi:hypothetical protein